LNLPPSARNRFPSGYPIIRLDKLDGHPVTRLDKLDGHPVSDRDKGVFLIYKRPLFD